MNESTLKLIELLKQEKTANEIAQELNISNKQLFKRLFRLKTMGFNVKKKYYYSGDIGYSLYNDVPLQPLNSVDIITSPEEQKFEAIVISDLHIGSIDERLDLLNRIYDYCVKNNIHTIFNAGDIIDGMFGHGDKLHDNIFDQIEYAIKKYPFDKNILNYAVLGNHDFDSLLKGGKDLALVLQKYRHDIVPIGYATAEVNIKNDKIVLRHPIGVAKNEPVKRYAHTVIFKGHYHKMEIVPLSAGNCIVKVPALSNIHFMDDYLVPSALKIKLNFNNGIITNIIIEQLLVESKIFAINSAKIDLTKGKKINNNDEVQLEEKKKILVP